MRLTFFFPSFFPLIFSPLCFLFFGTKAVEPRTSPNLSSYTIRFYLADSMLIVCTLFLSLLAFCSISFFFLVECCRIYQWPLCTCRPCLCRTHEMLHKRLGNIWWFWVIWLCRYKLSLSQTCYDMYDTFSALRFLKHWPTVDGRFFFSPPLFQIRC